ncbi:3-oxoacyl-ACP synthase III family protein [Frankia sp. CiP3]|uniref:3-oxoacyl-ACP synthase III family protein n=1 Tax=Frankia sp. CiP3 TaxID=2880971 RepID=UPI001EF61358|nr:3-oxoacyl-[acyl-carrier-protein] synthase III C-terminal domain-containing protein [Frankia sp. CiP3]
MGGIVDFEIRLARSRMSVHDMSAASGVSVADIREITHCEEIPTLGNNEQAWQLAVEAARAVMHRTPAPLAEIRQVIFAGSGEWDVSFWSPAAKVASVLGIDRAHCFEVANFCNAGMTAIQIALDKIATRGSGRSLVLIGDRLSRMVDYGDMSSKELFNFGDAAAAVLLSGDGFLFEVRHSAMRTDPGWSDYYFAEYQRDRLTIRRSEYRPGLAAAYVENFTSLIDETLDAIHLRKNDVAHFLINHGDRRMHEQLLRAVGIPESRSAFNYDRLGHMGGADTLIALRDLQLAGALRGGDLILLATSAMGFSWGITALEYLG